MNSPPGVYANKVSTFTDERILSDLDTFEQKFHSLLQDRIFYHKELEKPVLPFHHPVAPPIPMLDWDLADEYRKALYYDQGQMEGFSIRLDALYQEAETRGLFDN